MADTAEFTSDETREILYDKWLKTKPGTPYILPAQIIDVKSYPQMTLKDIAVNESVALDKREIAAMFGLPLFLIGQGKYDENEYNNFIDITIAPIVKGMAQELTKKLIISERYYIKFNLESLKAFKTETKIGVMYEGKKAGVFNANEIRVLAGYEPIDEPAMNSYNILENYIPIEKLGDQKKIN
jgi:HK97 family phage portal protein